MLDVYFYEAFAEEALLLKQHMPSHIRAEYTDLTTQEAGHAEPPARLISVRTQAALPVEWAPKIGGILSRSTGYDHLLDYAALAAGHPIQYGNLPLYCHRAVAEHAMMLWIALLRRLPRQLRQFREFHRDGLTGPECQGRTLAVVGVGNIGHEICVIGRALGMNVTGVDRDPRHADIDYLPIDEALAAADIVVCAMDYNATNRGYFERRTLAPGAARRRLRQHLARGVESLDRALGGARFRAAHRRGPRRLRPRARAGRGPPHRPPDRRSRSARGAGARQARQRPLHAAQRIQLERVGGPQKHASVQQIVAFLETGRFLWHALPFSPESTAKH